MNPVGDLVALWRWAAAPFDAEGIAFDRRYGTETRWFDWSGNYEPCRPSVVAAALGALDVDRQGCAFVDLGCGKGRALILARRLGFARVVGIEHRAALADVARRNVARATAREAGSPVEVVVGDAREATFPELPLVLFLYNPFEADVLAAVLDRVGPRDARLVYLLPEHRDVALRRGWIEVARGGEADWTWQIARSTR